MNYHPPNLTSTGSYMQNTQGSGHATNFNRVDSYDVMAFPQSQKYRQQPLLYPLKDGAFDILYSEEGDGEILVESQQQEQDGGHLRLITCIDISTLYKEKRIKAIEIAKEYSKLQHPNLLCVNSEFQLLDNNGTLMFYTESPDHIAGWKSYCKKKFTTDEMLCIFRQLCEALAYVHEQGLIHRDVHPTRIHSSFGLAKFNLIGMPYNYKKLLKKDNFCGHVNYSAPELIQERQTFSSKVDVWSLGCCLYYLCTKKDPFEGRNPQEIKSNIMYGRLEKYPTKFDPILKLLINKCLEKDEHKRLSAREMLEFQDQIELEAYGQQRSAGLLNIIVDHYSRIKSIPMNQVNETSEFQNEKYQNPLFFSNSRYPYQTTSVQDSQQELPETQNFIRASQTQNGDKQFQMLYENQEHAFDQQQLNEAMKTNASIQHTKQIFQQNYKNFLKVNSSNSNQNQSLGSYARSSIQQNFQNNFDQYYKKQGAGGKAEYIPVSQKQSNQLLEFQATSYNSFNMQPNTSVQPQKIVLPKQEQIQRQIKQHQDQVDPPLPPFINTPEQQKQINFGTPLQTQQTAIDLISGFTRFNLTQNNLTMFNAQRDYGAYHIEGQNIQQKQPRSPRSFSNDKLSHSPQQSTMNKESNSNSNGQQIQPLQVSKEEEEAVPTSIFKKDFIFEKSNDEIKDQQSSSGDQAIHQEDPSSSESRNELNKDEIEGIVAQIVDSSKKIKNQLLYYDGTKYVGEVVRSGRGIYYDQDGSIYDGEWFEDQRAGIGKMLFQDGSVYDGQWDADKIHGRGIYISSNGDRYEGFFNYGLREGYGSIFYRNGNSYQGQWKQDQMWGHGVFHFKNGNYYEGNFINGSFEGQGIMFFIEIGIYKGHFLNGNLEGLGRFDFQNGSIYEGDWRENKRHGKGRLIEADGRTLYNGQWDNDTKHGFGTFIQKGACIIEGQWKRGSLVEMSNFQTY